MGYLIRYCSYLRERDVSSSSVCFLSHTRLLKYLFRDLLLVSTVSFKKRHKKFQWCASNIENTCNHINGIECR